MSAETSSWDNSNEVKVTREQVEACDKLDWVLWIFRTNPWNCNTPEMKKALIDLRAAKAEERRWKLWKLFWGK